MAKQIFNTDDVKVKLRYRAICFNKDLKGSWTNDLQKAKDDLKAHVDTQPGHSGDIEIEQKMNVMMNIEL